MSKYSSKIYIFPTKINKFQVCRYFVDKGRLPMKIKNNGLVLDELDLNILKALQENAKQTYTEIGRRFGIAHSTVYDRVKKLEAHGIIKKYTTIIDMEKMGLRNVTAIMTIFTNPKQSERVAEIISEFSQVVEVYTSLSEELLIIAKVVADDQESLHSFIANQVAPLPGVLRIRTSIVTKKFKEENLPLPKNIVSEVKFISSHLNNRSENK